MAPEQAQGLDTLDARADVFALAAITYECITGTVPFAGNNGPSILLSILTKDPVPPSEAGKAAKFPVPYTMDDVMEVALAKNPAIRTKSVGALADAIGHAYGLQGDHRMWAVMPLGELAQQVAAGMARMPAKPLEAAADPFAAPVGGAPGGYGQPPQGARDASRAMDQAFQASREAYYDDSSAAGVPKQGNNWLLPVIVGVAALALGIAVVAFVALR
jgi:serine/threonine-protein kinase